MRFKPRSRFVKTAKEIVLSPLGAVVGLRLAVHAWSSSRSLVIPSSE